MTFEYFDVELGLGLLPIMHQLMDVGMLFTNMLFFMKMTTRWCVVKKRSGEMSLLVYTVWHHEVSSHLISGKVLYNLLSGLSIFAEGAFV